MDQYKVSKNYADVVVVVVVVVVVSELLSPQNIDSFPFNEPTTIFKDSEETKAYIETIT